MYLLDLSYSTHNPVVMDSYDDNKLCLPVCLSLRLQGIMLINESTLSHNVLVLRTVIYCKYESHLSCIINCKRLCYLPPSAGQKD